MRYTKVLFLVFFLMFSSCEFNITSARLGNTKICGSFDGKHGCLEDFSAFDWIPDTVFVSSRLMNAPKNTEIRYYWYQIQDGEAQLIDSLSYFNKHSTELVYSYFTTNNKPLGTYKVVLRVIADNQKPVEKYYTLNIPSKTAIHQARIGNQRDESTMRVSNVTSYFAESDEAIYFSATLYNLESESPIRVIFYHVASDEIVDEINLISSANPEIISQLNASLPISSDIPSGDYQLFVDLNGVRKVYEFVIN
jgi:hypothetical protein